MIMINSQHTVKLIEKCLAMKEDRLLRCGNNEPWGYCIMCAALGLLEAHLGTKTSEVAKSTSAERFVTLHQKLLANQEPTLSEEVPGTMGPPLDVPGQLGGPANLDKPMTPFPFTPTMSATTLDTGNMPWLMPNDQQAQPFNMDPSLELLGLNLNELWGDSWELG